MAEAVQMYRAASGKLFDSQKAADAHDAGKQHESMIEEFVQWAELSKYTAGSARNMLPLFLAFQAVKGIVHAIAGDDAAPADQPEA